MSSLSVFLLLVLASADATLDIFNDDILDTQYPVEPIPMIPDLIGPQLKSHPDADLTTLELVKKYGYNGELHVVTTSDGYVLELHRITGRANSTAGTRKPVALVMHGILCSSAAWVLTMPEKSLAYILADAGYDVWLGNARGNVYGRKHTSLSTREAAFWDFSWHEIGIRDLPAMIDYILKTTGEEKLYYLAHSQGSTAFFVMASEMPEYQNKIRAMFAMGPIAYCGRMSSPIMQFLARATSTLNVLLKLIGMHEFKPTNKVMKIFQQLACSDGAITQPICSNVFFLIAGFNRDQFNTSLMPIIAGHIPAGISTKQVVHYAQLINSGYFVLPGKFRKYDYNMFRNLKDYGSISPPSYDLSKIKVPVSLHYGANDWLANVKDVDKLYKELGNPIGKFRVPHEKFNHLDFMWAIDVKELLYEKILSLMTHYPI